MAVVPLLVAACGQARPATAPPAVLVGHAQPLQHGAVTVADVTTAERRFGLDLLHALCSPSDAGTLVSPASAFRALGMVDAAAGGGTARSVSSVLHLPVWSSAVVAALHDQQSAMAPLAVGPHDTVRTSDRVWPSVTITPTKRFLDDVRTAYGATLHSLDFSRPAEATDTINAQVSQDTDGLIPRLFDAPLEQDTTAVLTDAVVLQAQWKDPFLLDATTSPFSTPAGVHQVRQMHSSFFTGYSAADGWQAAHVPYLSGTLEAVVLLPPTSKPCSVPPAATLDDLTTSGAGLANVSMPRLRLDQTHDLLQTLEGLGLPRVGDFSGLGSTTITDVVQKDVMTVDELGTTAAAATGVAMAAASASATEPVHDLVFDRPYLLLLQDTATHTPLFLAEVNDPGTT